MRKTWKKQRVQWNIYNRYIALMNKLIKVQLKRNAIMASLFIEEYKRVNNRTLSHLFKYYKRRGYIVRYDILGYFGVRWDDQTDYGNV